MMVALAGTVYSTTAGTTASMVRSSFVASDVRAHVSGRGASHRACHAVSNILGDPADAQQHDEDVMP